MERNVVRMYVLRDRIKDLAAEQKLLKRARKTTMPKDQWEAIRKELGRSYDWTPQLASFEAGNNTLRITVCLNLYHELRGSDYRHNAEGYYYDKLLTEERKSLACI